MNIRLKGMIRKEFYHVVRDKQTLAIILAMPIMMLLLYGYAITLDLKDVNTRIIDFDQTQTSLQFASHFEASSFFKTAKAKRSDFSKIAEMMSKEEVKLVIVIPKGFGQKFNTGNSPSVKIYIDGSDPNSANLARFYSEAFAANFGSGLSAAIIKINQRFLYNQNLAPPYFFVPGLLAFIMIMLSALLTAITVSREQETGTMEQLLVSPLKPSEIILGKTIPYLVVALTAGILTIGLGLIMFSLPFRGSIILLFVLSLFFLVASLAIGLIASETSGSQQEAMFKALLITLLPTLLLSGFIFPLESMLPVFQWVSKIIPATYFVQIIRGIMLKNNSALTLIWPITGLFVLMMIFIRVSISKFKVYLED